MNKDKINSLADKMEALSDKLDLSDELLNQGDNIIEYSETSLEKNKREVNYADIMNLQIMVNDFKYIRETLQEITNNAKRVQNVITAELLEDDSEKRANLIMSFAELSRAITDAQKLYILSYKEMSGTLLNLDKIEKNDKEKPQIINNNLTICDEAINTSDLIKQLSEK